ncbi:Uncharacterised protein [Vibrio cholerae]|nr:Uncharacterised protein [Vibrio cholerae]CSA26255.1 Uncharacterised protein [Vibrio cholerae]CSA39670.1 Uncharacterised protein [Vibrio cholerae]CSB37672.1 Uncharacterised protein [Vibrio cholerae]CSB41534.1 Uncharacterised protein [Vibrio cholerae]
MTAKHGQKAHQNPSLTTRTDAVDHEAQVNAHPTMATTKGYHSDLSLESADQQIAAQAGGTSLLPPIGLQTPAIDSWLRYLSDKFTRFCR